MKPQDPKARGVKRMERATNPTRKADSADRSGRCMINFKKIFTHGVIYLPTRARVALRAAYGWLSRSARFVGDGGGHTARHLDFGGRVGAVEGDAKPEAKPPIVVGAVLGFLEMGLLLR